MPERCASMRSIARWVLPVLVGPSTAVRRPERPNAPASAAWGRSADPGGRTKFLPIRLNIPGSRRQHKILAREYAFSAAGRSFPLVFQGEKRELWITRKPMRTQFERTVSESLTPQDIS